MEVVTTIIPSMFGLLLVVGCGRGLHVPGRETQVGFCVVGSLDILLSRKSQILFPLSGVAVAILGVCLVSTFNVSRSLEVRPFCFHH